MIYQIEILERNYCNWLILPTNKDESFPTDFSPFKNKLFSKDHFIFDNFTVKIMSSVIRSGLQIAAVLQLETNQTFGKKKNKLLYKCIPNDTSLPIFLVPYEMKNVGFSKSFKNMFVSIRFNEWENKHPTAILESTYGPVDDLLAFYEYQLLCKKLTCSFRAFQTQMKQPTVTATMPTLLGIEDRTHRKSIFTLDSEFTQEYDDAMEIHQDKEKNTIVISIYIANVCLWMETLQLWNVFPGRAASIFLPDKKRPMFPASFTEQFCSLKEKENRIVFFMDIEIQTATTTSSSSSPIRFGNAQISVHKNYAFGDSRVLENASFRFLLETCRARLFDKTLETPAELVASLMEYMNRRVATEILAPRAVGICYDSSRYYYLSKDDGLEKDDYCYYYCKITSPLRRLPDLLNLFVLQDTLGLVPDFSANARAFYERHCTAIAELNRQMFSIYKIQSECALLHLCSTSPEMLERTFKGEIRSTAATTTTTTSQFNHFCSVYLPELKLWSFVYLLAEDLPKITDPMFFRLLLFTDETKLKKKIRIQPIFGNP